MGLVRKLQAILGAGPPAPCRRRWLTIGPRLLASFLVTILLTGLIGFMAAHQLNRLSDTTDELSTRDLPEVVTVGNLRTLLFRLRDLEQRLVRPDNPDTAGDLVSLSATLDEIATQRATLLAFEPTDPPGTKVNDTEMVRGFVAGLVRSEAISRQFHALVRSGRIAQAQALEQGQQGPLLQSLLETTARLRSLEQGEASATAAEVQQQSSQATWLILALTLFSVPVSVALALLITRSLTRPLSSLLHATEAMTAGDLEADPQIAPGDELGRLAAGFNSMRLTLRSTIATLGLERQRTQAIIDASADGVMLVDAERRILEFNPAAERLSGWPRSEALGRDCCEVLGCRCAAPAAGEESEGPCPLGLALQASPAPSSTELHAYSRSGQQRWFALNCAPIPQDERSREPQRLVVSIHDISQRKAVEQLKSDFVAMVSHELRAPLSTVIGSVETLSLLDPVGDRESCQEVVDILVQQTRRLRQVVEEVLQVTRIDAGRLQAQLEPLPLAEFLAGALEGTRVAWVGDDRPLLLHAPAAGPLVWADRALLETVVRNLLDNARKYSPPGSAIEVGVDSLPAADRVQVRVSDRGPGIPAEQLERIFESFSRGRQTACDWTRGYGLGLYIARELLRAHGGEIRAENRREGGACFIFSLCRCRGDSPAGAREAAEGIPA